MKSPKDLTGPINLGNPDEFTILELAKTILRLVGGTSRIIMMPLPQDDPKQRKPDISLAKHSLGWSPSIRLEDGLRKTVSYFRNFLAARTSQPIQS